MRFLLLLHILAGAIWFGSGVLDIVAGRYMMGRDIASKVSWLRLDDRLGLRLYMPAAVVVLLTGIAMVLQSDVYGFGTLFVTIGFTAVIVLSIVGGAVFGPRAQRALAAYEAGDESTGDGILAKAEPIGYLDVAIFVITIAAMVWRWGV